MMRHVLAVVGFLAVAPILSSPASAGELRGRALVDGKPRAGVEVAVVPFEDGSARARREARGEDEPRALATATTMKDGRFVVRVDGPAPGAPALRLSLSGGGVAPVVLDPLVDPAGEDVGDLRLGGAAPLAGRVLDPAGGPVVGAKVTLLVSAFRRFDDDRTPAEAVPQVTTTDASGTFRFDSASAEGNGLRVEAPAFAVASRSGVRSGALARPISLELGTVVRGTVTLADGRTGAASALVRFEGQATTTRWAESRPDGGFVLEGVPRETGQIVADGGERGRGTTTLAPGSTEPARVALAPMARVEGRVVDADSGAPVPGVRLVAKGRDRARFLAVSSRDGAYALASLPPGTWELEADDDRFVRRVRPLTLTPGQVERVDVPLTRAAAVEGRVTDEKGVPIEGARVEVRAGTANPLARFVRRLEGRSEAPAHTSRDGAFRVTQVRPGDNLQLVVSHDDYESRTIGGLRVAAGATRSGIGVVLRHGLAVSGVVRDEDEKPLAGVELQLTREMRLESGRRGARMTMIGPPTQKKCESSPDGRFEFQGLEAGAYGLQARHPGFATFTRERLDVGDEEPEGPVEVVMKPGATLSGSVRDRSGNGAAGWLVSARLASSAASGPFMGRDSLRSEAPTTSDGTFLIEGAVVGEDYELQAMGPSGLGPRLTDVTAPAGDLELTVTGSGQVRGQAVDAESGRAVTDFEVVYQPDSAGGMRFVFRGSGRGPYQAQPFHSEDGSFVLDDVPAGRWTVEVRADGYQAGSLSGITVEEGGVVEGVDVRLSRGSVLTGQVLESRTGRPVLDATVQAELSGGGARGPRFGPGAQDFTATSDAEGRFEIAGLAPGTWSVTASHPDFSEATASVEVSDSPASVDLQLGSGGSIGGVVLAGGQPVEGADVAIQASGETGFRGPFGGGQSTLTDSGGRFLFDHLSAGRYELVATLRGHSSAPVQAVVTPDAPQEVSLTLAEGATIRGTVSGLPDALVANVRVNASGSDGYFGNARTAADGTFELTGVPEGLVTLSATAGDFGSSTRSAQASVTIGPGQGEAFAEVVFESGFHVEGRVSRGGQPVADAMVFASPESRGGAGASDQTDASGFYALDGLQEGVYNFVANAMRGDSPIRRTVTLSGDTTVDLEAPPARITGVVVDTGTGRPLGDVSVRVEDVGGSGLRFMNTASTDSAGRFAFEDLEPRTYRVTFQKPAYETEIRDLAATEDAREERIDLRRGEGLALEVRDGIYGTPLRGLFVRVVDASGASVYAGSVPLDSTGQGEVPSLKPGSYDLRVDSSGYAPVTRPVVVPSSGLSLALTPGGSLEIRVGPETLALPAPRGVLLGPTGQPYLTSIFSTDGAIPLAAPVRRIENVAPGRYSLAVEGGARHDLQIREGGATVVELP